MEAAMIEGTHRPLGFGAAFGRQFRLLWTTRRPLLLAVAVLAMLVLAGEPWSNDPKTRLLTFWPVWLVLFGPAWAFGVFYNEGPSNRLYHWSLPVGRMRHTAARVLAGLAWLWLVYIVLIGAGALMAAVDGDLWQFQQVSAAGWLNFFTGPLMGYLAVSVLTVASDYPMRWFFGLLALVPLTLSILDDWLGMDQMAEALLKPIAESGWGFFPVMVGGLGDAVNQLEHQLRLLQDPSIGPAPAQVVDLWWTATPIWIALLAGVVLLLASRHPDTLPRLRRSG